MSTREEVPLVPGELRGYRQFLLLPEGLYPVVHVSGGPWRPVERAVCAVGGDHAAPAWDCTCGLYGWYHPVSTAGSYGAADAVVSVSGRVVLGDLGFRAGVGRVEAITLPVLLRVRPRAARRAQRRLEGAYPGIGVYRSRRRMVREHPPGDLAALGIGPPDRARLHSRRAAIALWALFIVVGYSVLLLPHDLAARLEARWWPLLLAAFLAWQVAVIALMLRSQPPDVAARRRAADPEGVDGAPAEDAPGDDAPGEGG